jgi:rhodanese-related sulfurtransferase
MSPSGAEVIRQIRSSVEEVDPSEVHRIVNNGNEAVILDVRETEEWDAGHIPGAKHIPRGYLESRVEGVVGNDRSQRVIIYCASGQRSALAANTLSRCWATRTSRR